MQEVSLCSYSCARSIGEEYELSMHETRLLRCMRTGMRAHYDAPGVYVYCPAVQLPSTRVCVRVPCAVGVC